jgi:hypothetical protein
VNFFFFLFFLFFVFFNEDQNFQNSKDKSRILFKYCRISYEINLMAVPESKRCFKQQT